MGGKVFLTTGTDIGDRYGAVSTFNATTRRLVKALPFFFPEFAKRSGRKKWPPTKFSSNDIPKMVMRFVDDKNYHSYFYGVREVFIERQIKGKCKDIQLLMEVALRRRSRQSSMTAIRNFYGMRVAASGKTKQSKKADYEKRKITSLIVVRARANTPNWIIHPEDLTRLYKIAKRFWYTRKTAYGITSSELSRKIEKSYIDLVEASLHAIFPGNLVKFLRYECGYPRIKPYPKPRTPAQYRKVITQMIDSGERFYFINDAVAAGIQEYCMWLAKKKTE